ncbi:hypothetical protein KL905_002615 [Ogataea polymorpha]|uniref:Peroxin-7 n=2 Tax=Ogataea TaxID=461281 RepID=A0A1B7SPC7_9ASCO|nr:PTS2-targeted peroxisomal matrix protein import [Ogataea polymorpha]ABA64462.1 PTS2-targeted peroxisomal matrix protein import [Ogataea angusta]KAG7880641.1 hypothetical protein KL937_002203 [Ogataea polymorpha]KAG7889438.1 hypothetical protein KL936_003012 [Ogataea polymorpha]KAG7894528.1 hypothetical protein KL908_001900 [Ogataea polymorpha]KAG7899880.1 hypothetical protein KL935_003421 [Ogataea polymorpha]
MLQYRTTGYNGYACKYSPFYDNKLAVATAANYGLVGNGKLVILSIQDNGMVVQDTEFETQDGLFDVAWSEIHENQVLTCAGDGSISLFDISLQRFPIQRYQEHTREVFSVYWNMVDKGIFCSSSWDGTIKVWSPNRQQSMLTLVSSTDSSPKVDGPLVPLSTKQTGKHPADCMYQATFSPHTPSQLVSVSSSSHCHVWDIRAPQPLQIDFIAHNGMEVLSCDYNKYRPTVIATASVDKSIKVWDLRMIPNVQHHVLGTANKTGPSSVNRFIGHDFAVRKVSWSPHYSDTLLSCSYDMTCRVWKDQTDNNARFMNNRLWHGRSLLKTFDKHKEFVIGCDWSLWGSGFAASVGWDEMCYIWKAV